MPKIWDVGYSDDQENGHKVKLSFLFYVLNDVFKTYLVYISQRWICSNEDNKSRTFDYIQGLVNPWPAIRIAIKAPRQMIHCSELICFSSEFGVGGGMGMIGRSVGLILVEIRLSFINTDALQRKQTTKMRKTKKRNDSGTNWLYMFLSIILQRLYV